jgi:hypothetical protein
VAFDSLPISPFQCGIKLDPPFLQVDAGKSAFHRTSREKSGVALDSPSPKPFLARSFENHFAPMNHNRLSAALLGILGKMVFTH